MSFSLFEELPADILGGILANALTTATKGTYVLTIGRFSDPEEVVANAKNKGVRIESLNGAYDVIVEGIAVNGYLYITKPPGEDAPLKTPHPHSFMKTDTARHDLWFTQLTMNGQKRLDPHPRWQNGENDKDDEAVLEVDQVQFDDDSDDSYSYDGPVKIGPIAHTDGSNNSPAHSFSVITNADEEEDYSLLRLSFSEDESFVVSEQHSQDDRAWGFRVSEFVSRNKGIDRRKTNVLNHLDTSYMPLQGSFVLPNPQSGRIVHTNISHKFKVQTGKIEIYGRIPLVCRLDPVGFDDEFSTDPRVGFSLHKVLMAVPLKWLMEIQEADEDVVALKPTSLPVKDYIQSIYDDQSCHRLARRVLLKRTLGTTRVGYPAHRMPLCDPPSPTSVDYSPADPKDYKMSRSIAGTHLPSIFAMMVYRFFAQKTMFEVEDPVEVKKLVQMSNDFFFQANYGQSSRYIVYPGRGTAMQMPRMFKINTENNKDLSETEVAGESAARNLFVDDVFQ